MPNDKQNGLTQAQLKKLLQAFSDLQNLGELIEFDERGMALFEAPFPTTKVAKLEDPISKRKLYDVTNEETNGIEGVIFAQQSVDGIIGQGSGILEPPELTRINLNTMLKNAKKIIILRE